MTEPDGQLGAKPTLEQQRLIKLRDTWTATDTLTRLNANARATVGTVATIGTLLTALGLVSAQTLLATAPARWFALTAVAVAVLAVLAALVYLGLRLERIKWRRLDELERWYGRQLRRAWLAVAASWLLVLAVLLAATAGIVGIVEAGSPNDPTLGLTLTGTGEDRKLDVRVDVSAVTAGSEVVVEVTGLGNGECVETLVLEGKHRADRTGKVTVTSSVSPLPCNVGYELSVKGDDVEERTLTIP